MNHLYRVRANQVNFSQNSVIKIINAVDPALTPTEIPRSRRHLWVAMLSVILVGASVFTMALFVRVKSACPLEITVKEIKQVGHRYHLLIGIHNPGQTPIMILRGEMGFPDVFLTDTDDILPVESLVIGDQSINHPNNLNSSITWSKLGSNETEWIPVTIHIQDGGKSVAPSLMWNPDFGLLERAADFVASKTPHTDFGHQIQQQLLGIGTSRIHFGTSLVPLEACSTFLDSPLRNRALKFIETPPPPEFSDAETRRSYRTIQDYANRNFEFLEWKERVKIEEDAWQLYNRYESGFPTKAVQFGSELWELIEEICMEVEYMHPKIRNRLE